MERHDLLLEIGCEELPSSSFYPLIQAMQTLVESELKKANLNFSKTQLYATPRRIALLVHKLDVLQQPQTIERRGPSLKNAYDKTGSPTLACLSFVKSAGISINDLDTIKTDKGEWVYAKIEQLGRDTIDFLPEIMQKAIAKIPLKKPMRWGDNSVQFVRPVHWAIMLFGNQVVPTQLFGIPASRETYGHRFLHPNGIKIHKPAEYEMVLKNPGKVIADVKKRRDLIHAEVKKTAAKVGQALIDKKLLDEVTSLVEWPVVLLGSFAEKFLQVPPEALICAMQSHQKYFPVVNAEGKLQPHFILVSNIASRKPEQVVLGNERVLTARLADAAFFYEKDKQTPLSDRSKALAQVVFQNKLGSLADKTQRIAKLAQFIGKKINAQIEVCERAALLAKCDLLSEMVGEFPELQGIMGYYYALHDQESKACAVAIKEHYLPRFSGDNLPRSLEACTLALADRVDTLVGIFGINQAPSGDKDPFALRRAALGIIRILIEKELSLDLAELIKKSIATFSVALPNKKLAQQVVDFMMERLRYWYLEQAIPADVFAAVAATHTTQPLDFQQRVQAVCAFQKLPEAQALTAANKRVGNILKKCKEKISEKIKTSLLQADCEKNLANLLATKTKEFNTLYDQANYTQALTELAALKQPIDQFFDEVMIMAEDNDLRNNRLALLNAIRTLFTQVADISLLQ